MLSRYTIHAITNADCTTYDASVICHTDDIESARHYARLNSNSAYGACIVDRHNGGAVDFGAGFGVAIELPDEPTEVIPDMAERVRAMHEASNG